MHSILAASESGVPQGLLPQRVWVRDDAALGKKHARHTKVTRDKESPRWLDSLAATQAALPTVPCLVTVADREADLFDFLAAPRSDNRHCLIRAAQNRRLAARSVACLTGGPKPRSSGSKRLGRPVPNGKRF